MRLVFRLAVSAVALSACSVGVDSAGPASNAVETGSEPTARSVPAGPEGWLMGQLHMHTSNSPDSTSPVMAMIGRYEDLGFDFIVITDHNESTKATTYAGPLQVFAGIEMSRGAAECPPPPFDPPENELGWCHLHVNSLFGDVDSAGNIPWGHFGVGSPLGLSEYLLTTANQLGGLAMINHPDWYGLVDGALLVEQWLRGAALLEIANASTEVWRVPPDHQGLEALWDSALSSGANLYGVATDDAHAPSDAGFGWVMVRAEPTRESIIAALARGDFYSSTGVILARVGITSERLTIEVMGEGPYRIEFIGTGGRLISSVHGNLAVADVPADGYVRAVVTAADGTKAWTQPVSRRSLAAGAGSLLTEPIPSR